MSMQVPFPGRQIIEADLAPGTLLFAYPGHRLVVDDFGRIVQEPIPTWRSRLKNWLKAFRR